MPLNEQLDFPGLNIKQGSRAGLQTIRYTNLTVALLPVGQTGEMAFITDANSTSVGTIVVGGGANKVIVVYNGINWIIYASVTPGNYAFSSSNPTTKTTASTAAFVMAGFNTTITPTQTGKVMMVICGMESNNTINDGAAISMRYGTGTPPTNGAALTGNNAGTVDQMSITSYTAGQAYPFTLVATVTGLTLGTAYWVDGIIIAITGGTASFSRINMNLMELP